MEYQDLDPELDPYTDITGQPTRSNDMTGFQGYDQWKTASPYDDEPDFIEEAELWMKHNKPNGMQDENDPMFNAYWIMEGLLRYLDEN